MEAKLRKKGSEDLIRDSDKMVGLLDSRTQGRSKVEELLELGFQKEWAGRIRNSG